MNSVDDMEPPAASSRAQNIYEVFNPEFSVGVACDPAGIVVGLHLSDDIVECTDDWLAGEIVRLARLARMKSRMAWRRELLDGGMLPHVVEARGLPTEEEYRRAEAAEFGDPI